MLWKIRNRKIEFTRTWIAGILNVTPDSFSGGSSTDPGRAVDDGLGLIEAGADMLDIGAESTRPGADPVSARDELSRLLPVLTQLRKQTGAALSIDTTKAEVARVCLEAGADIVNDVSALETDGEAMARTVRDFSCGLVLMHRRGNPKTMQDLARYSNVAEEVLAELRGRVEKAKELGVSEEQIAVDPGLGFAKNADHNLELLRGLGRFHELGRPVMLGPSRKAFIGRVTGREAPDRDCGTAGVAAYAAMQGVQILRVHNVSCIRDAVKMIEAIHSHRQEGEEHVRT